MVRGLGVLVTVFGAWSMREQNKIPLWVGVSSLASGVVFSIGAVSYPYIASAHAIPNNLSTIVNQDVKQNYKVEAAQVAPNAGGESFISDLAQDDWADRPHVAVKLKDGRSLTYEVGFDSKHELRLYPITDTQQVNPDTLRR